MKVNIYETVEISDEQRVKLAVVIDNGKTKPKRQATRDEIKAFIWAEGSTWETVLVDMYHDSLTGEGEEPEPEPEDEDEDTLADDDDDDDDLDDLL